LVAHKDSRNRRVIDHFHFEWRSRGLRFELFDNRFKRQVLFQDGIVSPAFVQALPEQAEMCRSQPDDRLKLYVQHHLGHGWAVEAG